VVERRTLSDSGNALEAIVTVKDPGAFKAPWSGSARYSPACLRCPRISVETASTQIYRDLLATSDRFTLMSTLEAQLNALAEPAVLPFRSPWLGRTDGLATRVDWQPTPIHSHFLDVMRAHARQLLRAKFSKIVWPRTKIRLASIK
jgi:hypothetical protein